MPGNLFENNEPIHRRSDPASSEIGAREVTASGRRDAQKMEVLHALRQHPMMSSRDLAEACGMDRHMVARRLPDLREDGLVAVASMGKQRDGRLAMLWIPTNR